VLLPNVDNHTPAQNAVEIEKESTPVEYSRMIFGQFIEYFHQQIYSGLVPKSGNTVSRSLPDKHGFHKVTLPLHSVSLIES
jgi:hypothetical protein